MSGEMRVVRGVLVWGCAAAVPIAAVALAARGAHGGITAAIAVAIVLGNVALSAAISALAGRANQFGAAMIALPSFAIRLSAIAAILVALEGRAFVDKTVFAVVFGASLVAVLFMEARAMRRTPWLALTFLPKEQI
jgi:hypothetical protein